MCNFHSLEVVDHGSETQLQVVENLNELTKATLIRRKKTSTPQIKITNYLIANTCCECLFHLVSFINKIIHYISHCHHGPVSVSYLSKSVSFVLKYVTETSPCGRFL